MRLNFSPVRCDDDLVIDVDGDVIYLNGVAFDFGPLEEGARLPACAISSDWFHGDVARVDGEIQVTLMLPHGPDAPESRRFPESMVVVAGSVDLPPYSEPKPEPELNVALEESA